MNIPQLTANDIDDLSYPELVALVRETNRCPGGKRSIARIAQLALLDRESQVLEIGCCTGFTSLELATITRAQVLGVDVVPAVVAEAEQIRIRMPKFIAERVEFRIADVLDLPGQVGPFDLVVVGGATGFMRRKQEALVAYEQLLRPYGLLSITNLFYRTEPPVDLVNQIGKTIGTPIEARSRRDWLDLFTHTGLELYHYEEHELAPRSLDMIEAYVEKIVMQPHLMSLNETARAALRARWGDAMQTFNRNHEHLSYMVVLLRRNPLGVQQELFLPRELADVWAWL